MVVRAVIAVIPHLLILLRLDETILSTHTVEAMPHYFHRSGKTTGYMFGYIQIKNGIYTLKYTPSGFHDTFELLAFMLC